MTLAADLSQPAVTAAAMSDVGMGRSESEDAIAAAAPRPPWAVADGMGGHARGAWAARMACDAIDRVRLTGSFEADREVVAAALADANRTIHAEAGRAAATIGTTVAVLMMAQGRYACLWAGDSRVYLLRDGVMRQLTTDHSQVEALVAAGLLDRAAARDHPLGHLVTRAVGVASEVAIDVIEGVVCPGDVFLLCSDGLTTVVEDASIAAVLARHPPSAACRELIRLTIEGGAPDNVSVVVISVAHG